MRFLTELPKTYTGELVLGVATTTLDDGGEVTGTWDMGHVELADLQRAAEALTGPILQVPPMVSAVRVGGRRLHELARQGIEVERQARPVTVHRLEVSRAGGAWGIDVTCSSGTYVRVLAADIGTAVGGGAHLRNLRRLAIGSFTVEGAATLDQIEADPGAAVISPLDALVDYEVVRVGAEVAEFVGYGRKLSAEALGAHGPGPWAIADELGRLLAVYEAAEGGVARPAVVLAN